MEKILIAFLIYITAIGCCSNNGKFSDIPHENVVDSIRYDAAVNKSSKVIKDFSDVYIIKEALSNSYLKDPESIKLPPYTGTMIVYCRKDTFTYKVYENAFVSADNALYVSRLNLPLIINSIGK